MNRKKWLTAVVVIAVLAIAFFWGGNYPKDAAQPGAGEITQQAADGTAEAHSNAGGQTGASETAGAADGESEDERAGGEPEASGATAGAQATAGGEAQPGDNGLESGGTGQTAPGETGSKAAATGQPNQGTVDGQPSEDGAATGGSLSPSAQPRPTSGSDTGKKPAATQTPVKPTSPQGTAAPDKTKDKYQTEAVPTGKPQPVEWQDTTVNKKEALTATLSVSAAAVLNNLDMFNEDKLEVLPKDGVIYKAQQVTFYEGESVFDVLLREMKKQKIHMEFEMTPLYNSNYIEGINNIYEFDCGELSGWMYKVNNWFPNYGSSRYLLKDGDVIEWLYTCDLGRDIGGNNAAAGAKP
jgi:hypothetical protein